MRTSNRAFTLIETLVALFILSIALTGVFTVISFNLRNANLVKNSFIASALSQEGIEVTRNLRDTDWFAGRDFGSFGTGSPVSDGDYCVQWDSSELEESCDYRIYKDSSGIYHHVVGGVETPFERKITVASVPNDPLAEIIVTVDVSWQEQASTHHVYAEEHLYNWY